MASRGRPKGSGVKNKMKKQTQSSGTKPVKELPKKRSEFYCTRCPRHFTIQEKNFAKVPSPLYYNNDGYLHICNHCLVELYDHYLEVLGSEEAAIKRMCLKFDLYYNPKIIGMTRGGATNNSRIKKYVSKLGLSQYRNKTYDDTLDEEVALTIADKELLGINVSDTTDINVSKAAIERWGPFFEPEEYPKMNFDFKVLSQQIVNMDYAQETLVRDLCKIRVQQDRALRDNDVDKYDKLTKLYQSTLKNLNIKKEGNEIGENDCFGSYIADIEKYAPCEYYKDRKLYWDFGKIKEYCERFVFRPLKNLLTGSRERDKEYTIPDEES